MHGWHVCRARASEILDRRSMFLFAHECLVTVIDLDCVCVKYADLLASGFGDYMVRPSMHMKHSKAPIEDLGSLRDHAVGTFPILCSPKNLKMH
jgi:hypothetical protein